MNDPGDFEDRPPSSGNGSDPVTDPAWPRRDLDPTWGTPSEPDPIWSEPSWGTPSEPDPIWSEPTWSQPTWSEPVWDEPTWSEPGWGQVPAVEVLGVEPSFGDVWPEREVWPEPETPGLPPSPDAGTPWTPPEVEPWPTPPEVEPPEAEPLEAEPPAAQPVEAQPPLAEPEAQPVEAEPVEAEPLPAEPVEVPPAETEVEAEPAEEEIEAQPAAAEPVERERVVAEAFEAEPVEAEPAKAQATEPKVEGEPVDEALLEAEAAQAQPAEVEVEAEAVETDQAEAEPAAWIEPDAPSRLLEEPRWAQPVGEDAWAAAPPVARWPWEEDAALEIESARELEPEPSIAPEPEPELRIDREPEIAAEVEPEPEPEPEPELEAPPALAWAAAEPVLELEAEPGWAWAPARPELELEAQPAPRPEPQPQPEPEPIDAWSTPALDRERFPRRWGDQIEEDATWRGHPPGELFPAAARVQTTLAADAAETWDSQLDRRRPTTAEAAVPWLIGFCLLLAGMVIVLLALIYTSENGLLAGAAPSPNAALGALTSGDASPSGGPLGTTTPALTEVSTPTPEPTPTPGPVYGPLEMVYLGRSAALAPIYLLRDDFTTEDASSVLAQDAIQDVQRFAWAPDGTRGAAIIAGILVSIEPGAEKRQLATEISAVTFGADADTVYAVRVTAAGATDTAEVLAIDFASGESNVLASVSYPHPDVAAEAPLREAQFADEGGLVRLFWMADESMRLWILGAPLNEIDPDDGSITDLGETTLPTLWSPNGERRIERSESGSTTSLKLVDSDGLELAMTSIEGLVSHLRWAPDASQVVFTLGRSSGGGVVQDLFLWDLNAGSQPAQLTNTGAGFGAEWLGAAQSWSP